MARIKIKLSGSALRAFAKGKANKAVTRAVKKSSRDSARDMRSEAVKIVREKRRIKLRKIRRAVIQRKNKAKRLEDMEWGVGVWETTLYAEDYPHRKTKKGINVEYLRGKRTLHKGSFLATVSGGKGGNKARGEGAKSKRKVFKRVGEARVPLRAFPAPRVFDNLNAIGPSRRIQKRGRRVFQRSFDRLLPLELAKAKK